MGSGGGRHSQTGVLSYIPKKSLTLTEGTVWCFFFHFWLCFRKSGKHCRLMADTSQGEKVN